MDDYYSLLGVERDAPVDDIRAAYRERKASIDSMSGGSAKADAARLNKAWNVLSDPYQRGRYDAQREQVDATADRDGGDEADGSEVTDAAPARRRRFLDPPVRAGGSNGSSGSSDTPRNARARQARQPTLTYPKGLRPAGQRKRLTAMMIDLAVMLLVFIAATVAATAAVKNQHPEIVKREDAITEQIDDARPKANELDDKADAAEAKSEEVALDTGATDSEKADAADAAKDARAASDKAKDDIKDLEKEFSDLEGKLIGTRALVTGFFYLLGVLILAIPSARNGQTLGKRLQGIKVVREDGSPIGWVGAFRRYGLLIVATFLLGSLLPLGPLAAALVLLAVTRWMSNPNFQGVHDRLVHTIVVEDDREQDHIDDRTESNA